MTASFGFKLVYSASTFVLDQTNGIIIQSFNEPLTSKVTPIRIPRMDGALMDTVVKLSPKVISIQGLITGTSKENYRTNKDAFRGMINWGKQKLYYFDDRYINVQKSDFPIQDYITGLYGEFSLDLMAVDPFWYAATSASTSKTTTGSTSYSFTVTTAGDAPTPPVITISATSSFTNPSLVNLSYTPNLSVSHTGIGSSWVVTCSGLTATMGLSNSLSLFTGDFWDLISGANSLRFDQNEAVPVTISISYTDRWY